MLRPPVARRWAGQLLLTHNLPSLIIMLRFPFPKALQRMALLCAAAWMPLHPLHAEILNGTGFMGGDVHMVERTPAHPKGIWRTTSLRSLLAGKPQWRVQFDSRAAPSATPNGSLHSVDCLPPDAQRCLLLFKNTKGTLALREYDSVARAYVPQGFSLPFLPMAAIWHDDDNILIATDTGPGSLTLQGQPRILRLWTRGTKPQDARAILAGFPDDRKMEAFFSLSPGGLFHAVSRVRANGTQDIYHVGWANNLVRAPLPPQAEFLGFFQGRGLARLHSAWQTSSKLHGAGSIIAWPLAPLLGPERRMVIENAYVPPQGMRVDHATSARDTLFVVTQKTGSWQVMALRKGAPLWRATRVLDSPEPLRLVAGSDVADVALMERAGQLWLIGAGNTPRLIAARDE